MKRLLAVLLSLLLFANPALATIGAGGGISVPSATAQVVTVGKSGAQFTVICGADCTSTSSTCAAGSAIARITDSSITKPYVVQVGPGVYDECVRFDNVTDIHLQGSGWESTIIRPTVTTPGVTYITTNTGVISIGGLTEARATKRIEVSNLTAWNDDWGSPTSAIFLGVNENDGLTSQWDDIYIHNVRAIGHHDAIQWIGSDENNDDQGWPIITIRDVEAITGADCLTAKWVSNFVIDNVTCKVISNYCEDTTSATTAAVTGTVRNFDVDSLCTANAVPYSCCSSAGTGTCDESGTIPISSSDTAIENFYVARTVTMSGGSCPGTAVGSFRVAWSDATNDILFLDSSNENTDAPDTNCSYSIAAVPNAGAAKCTDIVWRRFETSLVAANFTSDGNLVGHKKTCFHAGAATGSPTSANNNGQIGIINNLNCYIQVNSGYNEGVAAILSKAATILETVNVNNLNAAIYMNENPTETTLDAYTVGCVNQLTGGIENLNITGMNCKVVNTGDPNTEVFGVSAALASMTTSIRDSTIDISHTVGSWLGDFDYHFVQSAGTLNVLSATSPQAIASTGTIGGWSEECYTFPDLIGNAANDDITIPISDALVGLQVAYVGCRCLGTCGGAEDLTFEDDAGNAFSAAVACVDNTADMTWTDVRADADALIPVSKSPRFDTTTASGTATDDLQVCLRYTTSRWNP